MTNCIGYIRQALETPRLRQIARRHFRDAATGDLLASQGRQPMVRASDYGSCRLELWAQFHDALDPAAAREAIDDNLARLDLGTLIGAWEAALLKAAAEEDGWLVTLEFVPAFGGHIDALLEGISEERTGEVVVVEFKSTYDTAPMKNPEKSNMSHLLQAADYSEQVVAQEMVLVYIGPCVKKGSRILQFSFDPRPYYGLVAIERARLRPALDAEPPVGDPADKWRCFTCRYTACARNKKKLDVGAQALEELFA